MLPTEFENKPAMGGFAWLTSPMDQGTESSLNQRTGELALNAIPVAGATLSKLAKGARERSELPAPALPAGGYMAQPLNVDSSQAVQPAYNSNMPAYLNYMQYRGGQQ